MFSVSGASKPHIETECVFDHCFKIYIVSAKEDAELFSTKDYQLSMPELAIEECVMLGYD